MCIYVYTWPVQAWMRIQIYNKKKLIFFQATRTLCVYRKSILNLKIKLKTYMIFVKFIWNTTNYLLGESICQRADCFGVWPANSIYYEIR